MERHTFEYMTIDPDKLLSDIHNASQKARRNTTWERQCRGKLKTATLDLAKKLCEEKGKEFDKKFRPYYCVHCKNYHISTVE